MKLYPPSIEGKLPAFTGTSLRIPFSLNRVVSMTQVSRMRVIIKAVKSNKVILDKFTGSDSFEGISSYDEVTGNYYAIFDLKDRADLKIGQYYKIQIAFVDLQGEIGYYSSIGIIKCTTYPIIEIPSLTDNYYGNYEYVGLYRQPSAEGYDATEKVYSYCFELRDAAGNIVSTTGTLIHNSATDVKTDESSDSWSVRKNLIEGVPYYITYKVTTMNGLECESQSYVIVAQESVNSDLQDKCDLIATLNFDDGYIQLALRPKVKNGVINGSFVLARASSEDNFDSWNEIYRFSYKNLHIYASIGESPNLISTHPDNWHKNDMIIWEDFTIQQGVEYIYSIQAYNAKGLYSNRMVNKKWELDYIDKDMDYNHSYKEPDGYDEYRKGYYYKSINEVITADFEDMFLFDGERQLKIRYNPKVSSFKSTVLESKIDTLGGKYPFVFRNGNVEYKEFPISGLLSLISDPNERFLKGIQTTKLLYRSDATGEEKIGPGDTQVTMDNLRRERQFKMEALAWLTNGEPKLFRSPSEGNYIVRVMNVSMSPLDVVGRMLHNFSGTAYEIADCNFNNLNSYGFITAPNRDNRDLKIGQVLLANPADFTVSDNVIYTPALYQANLTNVRPGTIVGLNFADGLGNIEVEIGGTGGYYVLVKDKAISSITLLRAGNTDIIDRDINAIKPSLSEWENARLTFCYYDNKPTDNFSFISNISVQDEFRQFIGFDYNTNIIDILEDIRRETGRFHYIRVTERPIQAIYKSNGKWSRNPEGNDIITDDEWNDTVIYYNSGKYYNGHPNNEIAKPSFMFNLNGNEIDMGGRDLPLDPDQIDITNVYEGWLPETRGRIDAINGVNKVDILKIGSGLILEIAYRVKFKEYAVEDENYDIIQAKQLWQEKIVNWNNVVSNVNSNRTDIKIALTEIENAYDNYISLIQEALPEEVI